MSPPQTPLGSVAHAQACVPTDMYTHTDMHTCGHTCIHGRAYTHAWTCMQTWIHMHTWTCMHTWTHAHTQIHVHTDTHGHVCKCGCVCTHRHACTHGRTCTHADTCAHMDMYVNVDTYAHTDMCTHMDTHHMCRYMYTHAWPCTWIWSGCREACLPGSWHRSWEELAVGSGQAAALCRSAGEDRSPRDSAETRVGPGFPLTWAVGREPGWFSVSKAGMEQSSEPQPHHPGHKRLELSLPCQAMGPRATPVPRPCDPPAQLL